MDWTWFRAFAERIGLSREQVEAVERGGVPTYVPDPRNPIVQYRVRPDPDWTQRLNDAWNGVLENSRRQAAGTIPIPDGRLLIADASAPERGVTANVAAGDYEIVLTIAHLGAEEDGDYEEHVSHAFALLRGSEDVALIEPMSAANGTELEVEAVTMVFAGTGAVEQIAAERAGGRPWAIFDVPDPALRQDDTSGGHWTRVTTRSGTGALIAVAAGVGRGTFPLFMLATADGRMTGVLVDFFVDNRTD